MMEYELEALFMHHAAAEAGCRLVAYTCICASGPANATLHYGHAGAPNDRVLADGSLALLDMGAEYHCYTSDITCTYPVGNGGFSPPQRLVYNGVLDAQRAVLAEIRPGANWADLHRLATRTVLESLRGAGVLVGELEELVAAGLGKIFLPCGMGHLIGACRTLARRRRALTAH